MTDKKHSKHWEQHWEQVRRRLRAQVGAAVFESWLAGLTFSHKKDTAVVLLAPTEFFRRWIEEHYAELLQQFWRHHDPHACVRIATATHSTKKPSSPLSSSTAASPQTFKTFVRGHSNALAYGAARQLAGTLLSENKPFLETCNPFFLQGGVGLGKTHLLRALAHALREQDVSRRILYMRAPDFLTDFVKALQKKSILEFKQRFCDLELLLVDDIQFLAGKTRTQEEFFHIFNTLMDEGCHVVLSSAYAPQDLKFPEAIRSRLQGGLVVEIYPAEEELRQNILRARSPKTVPEDVLVFLARRVTSSVRELLGTLTRVTSSAEILHKPLTLAFAQEAFRNRAAPRQGRITVNEIQRRVAHHFHISKDDLLSKRRSLEVARPRQVAMYLAKKLTPRSLPDIGRRFGGRDHTTVIHAVKRIEALRHTDKTLQAALTTLKEQIETLPENKW